VEPGIWIPVAAHGSGYHNSQWRTDLGLLNTSDVATEVTITVFGSDGEHVLAVNVQASSQLILVDFLARIPYTGGGAVHVESSEPVIATSRTYNELDPDGECFPAGTLGQFLDSSADLLILNAGETGWIPHLVQNVVFRTNIALTNVGDSTAKAIVYLYATDGMQLASYPVSLEVGQWKQENQPFVQPGGVTDLQAGYAIVEVTEGSVVGYASVIDNISNDPTTMPILSTVDLGRSSSIHSPRLGLSPGTIQQVDSFPSMADRAFQ
jgi:hypothetical protein